MTQLQACHEAYEKALLSVVQCVQEEDLEATELSIHEAIEASHDLEYCEIGDLRKFQGFLRGYRGSLVMCERLEKSFASDYSGPLGAFCIQIGTENDSPHV